MFGSKRKEELLRLLQEQAVVCVAEEYGFLFDVSKSKKRSGRLRKFDKMMKTRLKEAYKNASSKSYVESVHKKYNDLAKGM